MLSKRGEHLLTDRPPLVVAHFRCAADPYDREKNPGGYINLGTAENFLLWDLIEPRLQASLRYDHGTAHYAELHGRAALRNGIARYLSRFFAGRAIDPEALIVTSGASCAIDILTYALCDRGEAVLVPAPYYSGFDGDIGLRAEGRIVPVAMDDEAGFPLSIDRLSAGLREARASGIAVRAVVINNPHNPLGNVLSEGTVRQLIDWSAQEKLHCIFDEIYANSIIAEDAGFVSALKVATPQERHVHVVFGFAKDFGLSGFKAGYIHTLDEDLTQALRGLTYLCPVSNLTQDALTGLLADERWLDRFFIEAKSRLQKAYACLVSGLAEHGIALHPPQAGIFAWLDLRAKLPTPDFAGEEELRRKIFDEHKVSLSPGQNFHAEHPGWFRLCFAQPEEKLREAIWRIARALKS